MKNYLLKDENAVYYECGFSCDNEIFIRLGSEAYFITDSRYRVEAKEFIKNAEVIEAKKDLISTARKLIKKVKKISFDPNDWSVADFEKLSLNLKTSFQQEPNFSQQKRIIKSEKEIKIIKKAVSLGAEAFDSFALHLQDSGLKKSEKWLFFDAIEKFQKHGKYDLSFDPIVAFNENAAKPHALPSKKRLNYQDLILVDAGLKYKRYCSDRTRTATFSKDISFSKEQKFNSKKEQKIYDTVLKAQEAAIKIVKPGVKAKKIDQAAREVIEKAGFGKYFIHSTGHGVGLDIHELPYISKKSEIILEENMIFTIEPGIYIPNKFGVRIEDMICVTSNGMEIL
jgi:Xaa-Pro aminopeptidase